MYTPLREARFLLGHVIPARALLGLPLFAHVDRETLDRVVEEAGRFCAEVIAPLNAESDRTGAVLENGRVRCAPGFVDAYRRWREAGWPALALPPAFGGQGLPEIAQMALSDAINGACLAFGMVTTSTRAAARVLLAHAEEAIQQLVVPKLVSGEWTATITMTEPQAGSDIGLARTRAVRASNGGYRISGTKIFISWADHDLTEQIVHIVLARTEGAPAGVKGLSLFLVPARRIEADGSLGAANSARVLRLEHKMGLHGSPTCELRLEAAEARLIGAEGDGIRQMFTMINTMRLEVAAEGAGLAGAAADRALRYALARPQGSAPGRAGAVMIAEHPDVRRMLLTMKALADAGRALCYEAAYRIDLSRAAASAEERGANADLAAWLLPIGKAGCTEAACTVASLAIQTLGGHGYIRDSGVEQFYRDARITPIFEGTNGIQAVDLVSRKLIGQGGRLYRRFAALLREDLDGLKTMREVRVARGALEDALVDLEEATAALLKLRPEQQRDALAGATPYLELAGRVAFGWMLLRMAGVSDPAADPAILEEKRVLARFFAEQVMVDCEALALRAIQGSKLLYEIAPERLAL
jgi:alkylation response protein AidB-like acyl-CoA dehydrogenase